MMTHHIFSSFEPLITRTIMTHHILSSFKPLVTRAMMTHHIFSSFELRISSKTLPLKVASFNLVRQLQPLLQLDRRRTERTQPVLHAS